MFVSEMEAGEELATWQGSLFVLGAPSLRGPLDGIARTWLDATTWVDQFPGWVAGADALLADLAASVPWRRRKVTMYGRLLDEPRLTAWWSLDGAPRHAPCAGDFPAPVAHAAWVELCRWYERRFDSLGANLYRDGRDSVAWHSDRIGRTADEPLVAIVSLGARRPFLLRPKGGGRSTVLLPGDGDLFVLGGRCQHDWEHTVPKVTSVSGPRLSLMYRHASPDGPGQETANSDVKDRYRAHRIVMERQAERRACSRDSGWDQPQEVEP